jgi:hypothetical protein
MLVKNSQHRNGWQRALKDCFSHHWTQIQGGHIHEDPALNSKKQSGDRRLEQILHHPWTLLWQVWLARNACLHGRKEDETERKRLEKSRPQVSAPHATHALLLAFHKQLFKLPMQQRMQLHSRQLETWVRLVTRTVKGAIADADQFLYDANHTITSLLATPDQIH